ncbi:MAG: [Fe-Fe] hydrogenase large subunit C-terminal domain-containing protein, partial [Smithellaceae bacterium]|nr:[Fe-Fe] hydrogenase large subunit C-terminal domain-containing protein [Smithellaceae bacterium]
MEIVSTIPERCKRCYTCVRECPAKAIKVEYGQAMVIDDRCIACGNCLKVCAQKAKKIKDSMEEVARMIKAGERVIACLAPSFPAAFTEVKPGQVLSGLRALGFEGVWDVSLGAELVALELAKLYRNNGSSISRCITSPCPAVVAYVERFMPSLR